MTALMRKVATCEIVFSIHPHVIMRIKLVVALHSGTQRVLVANLPVKAQVVVQPLSVPVVTHVAVLKNIPDAFIGLEKCRLRNMQVVRTIPRPIVHHTKQIQVVVAITQVQRGAGIAEAKRQILVVGSHQVEAETSPLSANSLDTYYCRNGCIVLSPRIGNHLNALYLLRTQPFQLVLILHFSSINIKDRCTLAQHFQVFAL